tara:strand:+ start:202 stop:417 length:216 start_codon:yes stop_codon:yes gene_type:complete
METLAGPLAILFILAAFRENNAEYFDTVPPANTHWEYVGQTPAGREGMVELTMTDEATGKEYIYWELKKGH